MNARRAAGVLSALAWLCACAAEPRLVERPVGAADALLIRGVGVLDVVGGRIEPNRDVLIRGEQIAAIGLGGKIEAPAGAEVIDGSGQTLLPGLIDSHGHVTANQNPSWKGLAIDVPANLQAYLYCGVTTVLDPGTGLHDLAEVREATRSGALLGPRIYGAGRFITAPGGHPVKIVETATPWGFGWYVRRFVVPDLAHQVASEEEARAAVAAEAEVRPDFIKLIVDRIPQDGPRIDNAALIAAVEEARARDLRTVAHIGSTADAIDSGAAGIDAWVHGVYTEPLPDDAAPKLAAFGIPMVPTLAVWESYATVGDGARAPSALEQETVAAEVLDAYNDPPEGSTSLAEVFGPWLSMMARNREDRVWGSNLKRLHAAGVVIFAGSDAQSGVFPGPGLHRELLLLRAAGLDEAEVLRAATLYPARFLARSDDPEFGVVALGKRADLLLVDGNPLQDLSAVSAIRDVILGGVRLTRTPIRPR